jgi:putative ABC transport system permease protein
MRISRLVLAEIFGRPLNFTLSLLVVVVAAVLFIAGPTIINGYATDTKQQLSQLQEKTDQELTKLQEETDKQLAELDKKTKRIMRDMGVNLRIVHQDTKMGDLYTDFVAVDFPEDYVNKLANAPQVETIVHLIATLQEKIKWNGRTVLLVGMLPVLTASQKNAERQHMAQPVEEGSVVVGYELANGLAGEALENSDKNGNGKLDAGEPLDVLGQSFTVAEVRPEAGGLEDIQLVLNLHDAQQLVGKQGRIHQIMALNCKCHGSRISVIRKELEGVLPDTKVTEHLSRATAREQQRDAVELQAREQIQLVKEQGEKTLAEVKSRREHGEKALTSLMSVLLPLVVLGAGTVLGLMTWLNVRERRAEIGLLRALGKHTTQIASLFLVKALLIGVLGGALASLVCSLAYSALQHTSIAADTALARPSATLLLITVIGAPVVTAMASYLPMLSAVTQDPARVLTEE